MFNKRIKSILVLLLIALAAVLFMSWGGHGQPGSVSVKFQIKYLGFDDYNNGFRLHVNVSTNAPGHLTYMEEYYTVDSYNNPRFVSSKSFDGGDLVKVNKSFNASFDVLRPSGSYSLVKSVLLLDGDRIFEHWLTNNQNFIDNTNDNYVDDAPMSGFRNIDRYETVEKIVSADAPVAFNYTTLGDISEIDVMGAGKDDVSLKVEMLKGRDSMTANPGVPVYRYFNIQSDSVYIKNVSVMYRVENAWINKNISVRLAGWDAGSKIWRVLPTNVTDSDTKYTYFISRSNTVTQFAIIGLPVQKPKVPTINATKTPVATVKAKNDTASATPAVGVLPVVKGVPGFGIVIALIALIALIIIYGKRRKLK